ncbi:MAG: gephyrin-like molybdotransferase Glp [Solirubrobacterales bacterium]
MAELLPVADARAAVLAAVAETLAAESTPLAEAQGRVLAVDVVSSEDVPGSDNSAMDGFAVRAVDTARTGEDRPARLRLAGESRAGEPFATTLGKGEAVRISTGAVMPDGADAVVRIEDTDKYGEGHSRATDNEVEIRVEVGQGNDIRRAGDDVRRGDRVLRAGTELGPAELGVLASVGVGSPRCARRPTVAVVSTGDELLAPDEPMRAGGVRNSNAYTLPALARLAGAEVVSVERCADDLEATRAAVARAADSDVAVFCGGVSVGDHDHVKGAFAAHGFEERFWGVALRPGKPTWFGVCDGTLAFGLPGNPVSAFVTFVLFVRPVIRALQGARPDLDTVDAALAADFPRMERRDQAVRCSLELTPDGWLATPTGPQGSHILTSMVGADGLAVIEAGSEAATAGSSVSVQLLAVASSP